MNKTIALRTGKPRNPLVAAARFRAAGRHQPSGHSVRQQAHRALRRTLAQLHLHSP